MQFNNKLNLYGRGLLEKVMTYHNGVKSFINGTKAWKTCNKEKKKTTQNNKVLKEIYDPNYEARILERHKKYTKYAERLRKLKMILDSAQEDAPKSSGKDMTQFGKIVMGEIITLTGVRPVVIYRLTNGGYMSKKPGFNLHKVTAEECVDG
jgi:hypothetical protein